MIPGNMESPVLLLYGFPEKEKNHCLTREKRQFPERGGIRESMPLRAAFFRERVTFFHGRPFIWLAWRGDGVQAVRVMLDIRVIRENPEEVKARLKPRSGDAWKLVDDVLACDEARRNAETEKQALQSERNATSKQIGMLKKKGEDTSSIEARVREIGDRIRELDRVAEENAARLTSLLMNIPNLPHLECPVGADETANPEIKLWGEKPAIENPKDHVELAANLGMISFEDGARITGSGFVVYRGAGARLERALINFLLNTQTVENGYQEVGVPFVVKRECMEGTGQLPKFEEDMYGTEDQQMFLIPTAEVPVTNLYRDTILQESDLPIKMAAYTPCFRREAGSAV